MAEALTVRFRRLSNVLFSEIAVSLPFAGKPLPTNIIVRKYVAIWDTGATNSVITNKIVKQLDLKPTGVTEVHTANGKVMQNTYVVNIILPMDVGIQGVKVTEAELVGEADVLIGMDIISMGDFSVSNVNGITCMSFRMPSIFEADFVKEIQISRMPRDEKRKMQRNEEKIRRQAINRGK